jgi:hypothetical protein
MGKYVFAVNQSRREKAAENPHSVLTGFFGGQNPRRGIDSHPSIIHAFGQEKGTKKVPFRQRGRGSETVDSFRRTMRKKAGEGEKQ